MSASGVINQFVSLHLYENGVLSQPERLRVRANEVDKYLLATKSGKGFCYHSKV